MKNFSVPVRAKGLGMWLSIFGRIPGLWMDAGKTVEKLGKTENLLKIRLVQFPTGFADGNSWKN